MISLSKRPPARKTGPSAAGASSMAWAPGASSMNGSQPGSLYLQQLQGYDWEMQPSPPPIAPPSQTSSLSGAKISRRTRAPPSSKKLSHPARPHLAPHGRPKRLARHRRSPPHRHPGRNLLVERPRSIPNAPPTKITAPPSPALRLGRTWPWESFDDLDRTDRHHARPWPGHLCPQLGPLVRRAPPGSRTSPSHRWQRRTPSGSRPGRAAARAPPSTAWSKYDSLTKFNPWYFGRLRQFADLAEQKGLVLVNQMYFQHHLLEDAAHWMPDTP